MRKLRLFIALALLVPALPASGESLFYEFGAGFYFSSGTTVNLLRYRHETNPLFGFSSYYEASYASWNGPNHADALAIARGIRWKRTEDENVNVALGLGHISRTTENLGQPFEFYIRLGYDKSVGKALFSLGWIHYSDGKFIFGWSGPNNSENFATFSVGLSF